MSSEGAATPTATREEVLAWMESKGQGWRTAAKHFGVKPETVKSWAKRARGPLRVAPRATPPGAPAAGGKSAGDGGGGSAPPSTPTRAREPLTPALRRGLQKAATMRVAFLASPESLHHKDQKAIALSLRLLVETAPDALTLATDPAADGGAFDGEVFDAVFGKPAPQPLTALPGGKAATG